MNANESIMGLLPMRPGTITLQRRDITRLPTHARAGLGIGYAPEGSAIFPELTVAENLQISQWLAAEQGQGQAADDTMQARIVALFPEVRTFLQRQGLYLSGGQKKMVAMARAMALSPSVLLLDEAFEGLAPVVVQRFAQGGRVDYVKKTACAVCTPKRGELRLSPPSAGRSPSSPNPEPIRRTCWPARSPKAMRCVTEAARVRASSGASLRNGSYPVVTASVLPASRYPR